MNTLSIVAHVIRREFREILADRWTRNALFVVPLVAAVIMTLIYAGRTVDDLPTIVVDHDQSVLSRALIRALDAHEALAVAGVVSTCADGEERIASGKGICFIEIPEGFEKDIKRGRQVEVMCGVNGSNLVPAITALKGANKVIMTFGAGVSITKMEKRGVPSTHALDSYMPVSVVERNSFNSAESYGRFLIPGVLAALLQMVITVGAALTWVREFESGRSLELSAITPSILLQASGKALAYTGIGGAWSIVYFAGILPLAGVPYSGSIIAGLLAVLLMMCGMTLVAMMISAFVPTRSTAMQFVFIASSPAFILSGYTFPLMAMTWPAQCIANVVPLTPFLIAWRRIVLYGAGFGDVWLQLLHMAALAVLFGIIMMFAVRRKMASVAGGLQS
jgi:ABC-2 type transport system permease protein